MKKQSFYRTGGRSKGGKPIIQQMVIGGSEGGRSLTFLKYFLVIALIFSLGYWLYYLHIHGLVVWFNRSLISESTIIAVDLNVLQSETEHYLWSILNSLMMGVYLSAVLPVSGKRSWVVQILLIAFIITFAILSLGYLGVFLYLNFNFLTEKIYISNQREGLLFFISNLHFFLLLYAISLIIESETD